MKPFDLEKALAGEPVVTRDGNPVTQLIKFEAKEERDGYVLYGVVNNKIFTFLDSGKYDRTFESHCFDLFMAEPERWVNVYFNERINKFWKSAFYNSEKFAKEVADGNAYYQATIKIKDYKHEN
jgi:hypothetical protein